MNVREIFKKALEDTTLNGIDYIGPSNYKKIAAAIKNLPSNTYISEWRHTLGTLRYEYHIHINGIRDRLIKLYSNNIRGGNPRLVNLYSKKELEHIIQQAQKEGYS